jgi:hypothetical protein
MKIGFVLDDTLDSTDGVQQYVLTLGKWFTDQGNDVHYLVGATKRRDIPGVHSLSRNMSVRFNGNRMSMPLPAKKSEITALHESSVPTQPPPGGTYTQLLSGLLGVGSFPQRGRLPGAARSLITRLPVRDLGLVVTVGVLFWFLLDVGVLGRFIVYVFLHVGLLGLLVVRFWAED